MNSTLIQNRELVKPLIKVKKSLKTLYDDHPDMEKERIRVLSDLYSLSKRSSWLIGELLLDQKRILNERYENWKKYKKENDSYTQLRSIYQWVEKYQKDLGFGERTARRYIRLREDTEDQEVADNLGIKKDEIIRRIPVKKRDTVRKVALEEGWNTEKVEKVVNTIMEKKSSKDLFEKKIKPNLPRISIKLPKVKNQLILEVAAKYRNDLNNILQDKYMQKIKIDLFNLHNN